MASFRSSERGGGKLSGRFVAAGPVVGSPFSQAQILHLMKTEFARARRYSFPVSCMVVRVERLESLVDLHGAALRDTVRQELGRLVQDKTRGADHLGLASEDRYLIVLPHTSGEEGLLVADRLLEAFDDLEVRVGNNVLALQLCIGVSSSDDQETLFFDTLLARAEAALEHASRDGGSSACLFHKDQVADVDVLPGNPRMSDS